MGTTNLENDDVLPYTHLSTMMTFNFSYGVIGDTFFGFGISFIFEYWAPSI